MDPTSCTVTHMFDLLGGGGGPYREWSCGPVTPIICIGPRTPSCLHFLCDNMASTVFLDVGDMVEQPATSEQSATYDSVSTLINIGYSTDTDDDEPKKSVHEESVSTLINIGYSTDTDDDEPKKGVHEESVSTLINIAYSTDTDDDEPKKGVHEESDEDVQKSIRIGNRTIRFENCGLKEINMIKALCSYLGLGLRSRVMEMGHFKLQAEVDYKLFRALKFDFATRYMLLNKFLKKGDVKYESWDRYYFTFNSKFFQQRKDIIDVNGEEKKCHRFGGNNSMNIKTTTYIAKLYRNSLLKFGKLRHTRSHNDGVLDCLSSITYPGSKNVQAARLSLLLRLNEEQQWDFVKLQLGWEMLY